MPRPIWLFSMDTEQFCAPPLTTGALKAYFLRNGRTAADSRVELVHFLGSEQIEPWLEETWRRVVRPAALEAASAGYRPVFGFSCYTWNVADFLDVAHLVKGAVPGALVVAGGPHVQRAEDFLLDEAIDLIVLGEGEEAFTELLDCETRAQWADVAGCAYVDAGRVVRTPARARATDLDRFPSALEVVPLRGEDGEPLYESAAYETSRGCPYRCAFCEWGTGAIGTKIHQLSTGRIRNDLEQLVAGGVHDIWLCDSNFGALREDEEKAEFVVELRARTGLPRTFATSWSKNHNQRVQRIVRMLHRNGLLSHYHLALQTLTPLALELSHRKNMRANDYEPIVKSLAEEGVPVAAELIWGLPGDTLGEFERNLDHLLTVFPNINIFGYTLLPGTEFFDLREQYRLETVPVAGYGKAKGEYVVGCHTYPREEGEEGYFLITSYIVLARGQLMPMTARYLALTGRVPVAALLRTVMEALLSEYGCDVDRMTAYEQRSTSYVAFIRELDRTYTVIRKSVASWVSAHGADDLLPEVLRILSLDKAFCPRTGNKRLLVEDFDFPADRVERALSRMDVPGAELFEDGPGVTLEILHPGGVGELLLDPDGGEWMRGRLRSRPSACLEPEPSS